MLGSSFENNILAAVEEKGLLLCYGEVGADVLTRVDGLSDGAEENETRSDDSSSPWEQEAHI